MSKFIVRGDNVFDALHKAGLVTEPPEMVRRVVIDLEAGSVAKLYYEKFVDDSIIEVILSGGLDVLGVDGEAA